MGIAGAVARHGGSLFGMLLVGCGIALAAVPPEFVEESLPNGLQVSILPDPRLPVVSTQVWYHVGSADEDHGSRGLAHLFEHLMFGETATRSKRDYTEFHHRHGGYENAYTTPDETVYLSEIVPQQHLGVLQREADRMDNLVLTQANLENEIKIVTEELRASTENDPFSRIFVAATRALLGAHPYSLWPTGTKEDIAAATVESCRNFYEKWYVPNNAHLVVVGPVDPSATLAAVRRLFGPIPSGDEPSHDVPPLVGWNFPGETTLKDDLPPVEVALAGFPLPPADAEDRRAIALLVRLLAASEIDPFREELVSRRGKAVEAGTETLTLRRGGAIAFYSASLPYRRKRSAFRYIDEARVRLGRFEWLTEESLEAAKRGLMRDELGRDFFAARRATTIGRARWWRHDGRIAFDRVEAIQRVSREEVREAFRRYVGEPEPVRLYLKPERVPILVRIFGWVYPLVS